jgi:hypothetical protein
MSDPAIIIIKLFRFLKSQTTGSLTYAYMDICLDVYAWMCFVNNTHRGEKSNRN